MLRITASKSAGGATKYFEEALTKGDYYTSGQQSVGRWQGKAAERLGLEGDVKKKDFEALCHNQKPDGEKLNPRRSKDRKAGYDFTFSAPKSVSILHAVTQDERIQKAFEESVTETMQELEKDMRTQVGQGAEKTHAKTGNMVWAEFTHLTARPVDGVSDPHLHTHCYAMNTTWNEQAGRFQAGEFGSIKKDAPYYEAAFDARLAHKMNQLGYKVEQRGYSWELAGLDNKTLQKFSRRTAEVEQAAAKEAAQNGAISAKQKDKLGQLTRSKKQAGQSYEALRHEWLGRLSAEESGALYQMGGKAPKVANEKKTDAVAQTALDSALRHSLERKSVIEQKQLMTAAIKKGYGEVLPEEIHQAVGQAQSQGKIHQRTLGERHYITTDEALKEEKNMVRYVREGRGAHAPLNASYRPQAEYLNQEQKAAIHHVLTSPDQVTVISGGAGTGKTTLMKEVRQGIEAEGKQVFGFAPSSAASRGVMRDEGFTKADTLQQFLVNEKLQAQTKGQVIWVDEAGMISNKSMNQVFAIAKKQNARILLTGDVRQHSSVEAGDALRIIEERGGIEVARVNQIQRQRKNPHYKEVVGMIADDKVEAAVHKLDRMGGVIEIENEEKRINALVKDYVKAVEDKKTALVVSPVHREGNLVSQAIRTRLKEKGTLQGEEKTFTQLKKQNLTREEKNTPASYSENNIIQFHQHAPGFKKGERWKIRKVQENQLQVVNAEGKEAALPLRHAERFTVYQQATVKLAAGDRVRMTEGGKAENGARVHNGDIFTVQRFTDKGNIQLTNGKILHKDFGHVAHGYVTTSHSSQGKTVDRVFIAQSEMSKPAASKQQFYVSISRGREMAKVYTDDKTALKQAVMRDGKRMTASQVADQNALKKTRRKYWEMGKTKEKPEQSKVKHKQHDDNAKSIA